MERLTAASVMLTAEMEVIGDGGLSGRKEGKGGKHGLIVELDELENLGLIDNGGVRRQR